MNKRDKKIITSFLKETYGISLSFVSTKNKISLFKIYNFVKGIQRNKEVEEMFINKYDIPKELIEKTFENNNEKK